MIYVIMGVCGCGKLKLFKWPYTNNYCLNIPKVISYKNKSKLKQSSTVMDKESNIVRMGQCEGCEPSTNRNRIGTSVGTRLSEILNCEFRDADSFHSEENRSKMASGTPLTDQDRIPWLTAIHNYITEKFRNDETVVVTCSALKKSYRNILKSGNPDNVTAPGTYFKLIFLKGDENILSERLNSRQGHFMPASMLKSQLSTLEEPADDENCLVVDIRTPVHSIVDTILQTR